MKKHNWLETIALIILVSYAGIVGYYIKAQTPEVRIIEKVITKEVQMDKEKYACTPCIDEPPKEECAFKSFAYEAVTDRFNIYGEQELKRGDIFYFRVRAFEHTWDYFCTDNASACFNEDIILDKKFFKPIN